MKCVICKAKVSPWGVKEKLDFHIGKAHYACFEAKGKAKPKLRTYHHRVRPTIERVEPLTRGKALPAPKADQATAILNKDLEDWLEGKQS